jgi:hypothetical protein
MVLRYPAHAEAAVAGRGVAWQPPAALPAVGLVLALLLLPAGVSNGTPDLLQPVFDWNAAQHSANQYRLNVRADTIARVAAVQGDVRVSEGVGGSRPGRTDTPKEVEQSGVRLGDSLRAAPTAEQPAVAYLMVPLTAANLGANRLHAFVHISGPSCRAVQLVNVSTNMSYAAQRCTPGYDSGEQVLSAFLAPLGASAQRLRTLSLRPLTLVDEWQEILGDFYLLPQELGSGVTSMTLFVQFGSPRATVGVASMTDVTVTPIPSENTARGKVVTSSASSASAVVDGVPTPVGESVLTNGVKDPLGGQIWTLVDIGTQATAIDFEIDLASHYYVCSVEITWQSNSHISDWSFLTSSQPTGGAFSQVLRITTATEGSQPQVGSQAARWFACVPNVRRAKLHMARADNNIFMLTEIAVGGYELSTFGMCQTRCRHGGRCMFASDPVCQCVSKWGWRGPECNTDVNECALVPGVARSDDGQLISQLQLGTLGQAGCGQGDASTATCTNIPGSWECACRPGYKGLIQVGQGNQCLDINECLSQNGGCEQVCLNSPGSFSCACQTGYTLKADRYTCQPFCRRPCQHGGVCLQPDQCVGCAVGWKGRYCHEPSCHIEIEVVDDFGMVITMIGCYHGGECHGVDACQACLGGWTGDKCDLVPNGLAVLLVCISVGMLIILPTGVAILMKRNWIAISERGAVLLTISMSAALLMCVTIGGSANPGVYGIDLVVDVVQPEERVLALWLPYTIGYAVWFLCIFIRMNNLVVIHIRQRMPYSLALQLPLLWLPWAFASWFPDVIPEQCEAIEIAAQSSIPSAAANSSLQPNVSSRMTTTRAVESSLCGLANLEELASAAGSRKMACESLGGGGQCRYSARTTGPQTVTFLLWILVSVAFAVRFCIDCNRLRPLRNELPDWLTNTVFGIGSLLAIIAVAVAQLVGLGHANPSDYLGAVSPFVFVSIVGVHTVTTHSVLLYSAFRQDEATMDKYVNSESDDTESDSSDDESAVKDKANGAWKRGLGRAKGAQMLKLSGDAKDVIAKMPPEKTVRGGLAALRERMTKWIDPEAAEGTEEAERSLAGDETEPKRQHNPKGNIDDSNSSSSDSSDSASEDAGSGEDDSPSESRRSAEHTPDDAPAANNNRSRGAHAASGRGRGRGRGLGRGWGRRGRGSRGRGGNRLGSLGSASDQMRAIGRDVTASRARRVLEALADGRLTVDQAKERLGVPVEPKPVVLPPSSKTQKIKKATALFKSVTSAIENAATLRSAVDESSDGDSVIDSSTDEELNAIEDEVERFERIVGDSVNMPGYVAAFKGKEIGAGFDKHAKLSMAMSVQKMLILKDTGKLPQNKAEWALEEKQIGASAVAAQKELQLARELKALEAAESSTDSDEEGAVFSDTWLAVTARGRSPASTKPPDNDGEQAADAATAFGTFDFTPIHYQIRVHTGDRIGAGTDARVQVSLHGEWGNSGTTPLVHQHADVVPFLRGQVDTFSIESADLGGIHRLCVAHDNSGQSPGWFLDRVIVQNMSTKRSWTFLAGRWFDRDDGDGQIQRWLYPKESSENAVEGATRSLKPALPVLTADI